ncbi:hypothetical protein [Marivirga sp.]|uniref:hypothetical protein n=1 Tax=Marivirga sp. TaxID=2018662 RepID=UPI003DA711D5
MKKVVINLTFIFGLLIILSSCQKDEIFNEPISNINQSQFQDDVIRLGKKLENPYTIENMQRAFQNLKGNTQFNSRSHNISIINVTHLYVRFLPRTDKEYAKLLADTTLMLFDYPLDYEIEEGGTYYHDPELPDTSYTWKYCAVAKDYDFPNLEYEIIEELFLPESIDDSKSSRNTEEWSFMDELEIEALRITGNLKDESVQNNRSVSARRKWKLKGKIQMFDDSPGVNKLVPLRGVKARAYSWFTTKEDLTDGKGEFFIDHNFKGNVNYSIKWERNDFEIRDKRWGQAYYNGPRLKEKDWNLDIYSGMSRMYAIIHRAAHRYYYENRAGLRTPPKRNQMLGRVTIGAFDWDDVNSNGDHGPLKRWTTFPEIRIFKPNRACENLYATTIHELAHASHWELDRNNDYTFCDDIVIESWARGVQWMLSLLEYPSYSVSYGRLNYTGIVQDLIDGFGTTTTGAWYDFNEKKWGTSNIVRTYSDQVSGYTIRQLEDALIGQRTWTGWKNNIKNKYTNGTENNLDAAFNYWNTK